MEDNMIGRGWERLKNTWGETILIGLDQNVALGENLVVI